MGCTQKHLCLSTCCIIKGFCSDTRLSPTHLQQRHENKAGASPSFYYKNVWRTSVLSPGLLVAPPIPAQEALEAHSRSFRFVINISGVLGEGVFLCQIAVHTGALPRDCALLCLQSVFIYAFVESFALYESDKEHPLTPIKAGRYRGVWMKTGGEGAHSIKAVTIAIQILSAMKSEVRWETGAKQPSIIEQKRKWGISLPSLATLI